MNIFVTGATGWVGSSVVKELINAGHSVTGLVRSAEKAIELTSAGAKPLIGLLEDLDTLKRAASDADAVIHTAFNHDFSKFRENAEYDRLAIETMGNALEGTDRPLIITSGLAGLALGANETDSPAATSPRKSEIAARAVASKGVKVATIRLAPSVHGIGEHGFISLLVRLARQTGVSAYLNEGQNCWSGVYRSDAASVYRLALEQGITHPVYHAVADESVPFKSIAITIGRHLNLPVEHRESEHFGWFANFAGGNMAVSSESTRKLLDWNPKGPSLLEDLDQALYYAV